VADGKSGGLSMSHNETHQFRNDSVPELLLAGPGTGSPLTRQRGTLAAVALALFCIQVDFFALTLALPDMAHSFGSTPQAAQRTLSGYMLSLGSVFIVAGRVGDVVGRRRAFVTGCLLFTGTMIGAALAPTLAMLVTFRVRTGHSKASAYDTTLLIFAFLSLAASLIVMAIRPILVRRRLLKPLSMTADHASGPVHQARTRAS
jgi:MFS family permease